MKNFVRKENRIQNKGNDYSAFVLFLESFLTLNLKMTLEGSGNIAGARDAKNNTDKAAAAEFSVGIHCF